MPNVLYILDGITVFLLLNSDKPLETLTCGVKQHFKQCTQLRAFWKEYNIGDLCGCLRIY